MVINNERVAWIDATRMFAMLTVVLAHSIGASHMPNQTELIWWIVAWNMPLFIMLSGFTSWRSLSKISSLTGLYHHAIKLSKRMLVPTAVIGNAMNVFGRIGKREYVQCAIVIGLLAFEAQSRLLSVFAGLKKYRQNECDYCMYKGGVKNAIKCILMKYMPVLYLRIIMEIFKK